MIDVKELEKISENINAALDKIGLAPGDEIWTIRDACYECPELDDHCQIGCEKINKKYLEKTKVLRASITIGDGALPSYRFVDAEDESFSMKDVDVTVFTDRDSAIAKL